MDNPNIDSVDPQGNPNTPPAKTPEHLDLIPQVPPPIESDRETTYCKPDQTPLWKMILETAAVFLGLYVAGIYHGQLNVMQGQLGEIIKQYPELQKSADAAKTAAELAELSERPWIKIVDVRTRGNNRIVPALSFQYPGPPNGPKGTQATFQLQIFLKNIGHSVTTVDVDFDLFLANWDSGKFANEILAEEKKLCDSFLVENRHVPKRVLKPRADY